MRYADGEETEEKPKSRGSGKPSAKFLEFWKEVYDGGKKEVPNPRKKEKGKPWKPQVAASTAMLNRTFKIKVKKEFQAWLKQQKDDKKPKEEPKEESKGPKRPTKVYEALEKKINPKAWKKLKTYPLFKDDPHLLFDLCGLSASSDEILGDVDKVSLIYGDDGTVKLTVFAENIMLTRWIHFTPEKEPSHVYNDYFVFNTDRQASGAGTNMFSSQVDAVKKAGFKSIECEAAGPETGPEFIGHYVWPILGYDADLDETDKLRKFAKDNEIEMPKTIQELYAIPGGRQWWKENGWGLEAKFDLSEGSKSLEILRSYMEAKKAKGGSKKASKKPSKKMPKGWTDAPHIELDEEELNKIFQTKATKTKKKASLSGLVLKVASDSSRIRRLLIVELRNSMRN